jgi:hypothetical protein
MIFERLTEQHRHSNLELDFLFIDLENNSLVRIRSGRLEMLQAGYIGSHAAFERFQAERHLSTESDETFGAVLLPE